MNCMLLRKQTSIYRIMWKENRLMGATKTISIAFARGSIGGVRIEDNFVILSIYLYIWSSSFPLIFSSVASLFSLERVDLFRGFSLSLPDTRFLSFSFDCGNRRDFFIIIIWRRCTWTHSNSLIKINNFILFFIMISHMISSRQG